MKEIFGRINQYLLCAVLAVVVMYFGRPVLIPIVFAALLAMLMAPVCRKLDHWKFPRALSTAVCIFILVGVLAVIVTIVSMQFSAFANDMDTIKSKAQELVAETQHVIRERFGIPEEKQREVVKDQAEQAKNNPKQSGSLVTRVLSGITTAIGSVVLTLVFTFLFIYGKEKYRTFFLQLFRDQDQTEVKAIVDKIARVSQQYLTGRAMSVTIIAIMYSIGLSIVGIKNAIILACLAAMLTVIPYIGTVLGGLFPVMMAMVTEDSLQPAVLAIVVMFSIQTIDNYFIEPNVVGGEVNLTALTSILSILAGGLVWGVPGMILFLPMAGIVKIICDHIEPLRPIGLLIGDERGKKSSKVTNWFKEKLNIVK